MPAAQVERVITHLNGCRWRKASRCPNGTPETSLKALVTWAGRVAWPGMVGDKVKKKHAIGMPDKVCKKIAVLCDTVLSNLKKNRIVGSVPPSVRKLNCCLSFLDTLKQFRYFYTWSILSHAK